MRIILRTNDAEKFNVLNNFFISVFDDEGDGPLPEFKSKYHTELNDLNTSDEDMYKVLKRLNTSKSPDTLHPRLLKELSHELSYPLKLLFQKTLKDGKLPVTWKIAEVKPILKKGRKGLPW